MPTSDLLEKLSGAYQRWHDTRGGNVEEWVGLMTDDVRLRSLAAGDEKMGHSAPREGKAAALEFFAGILADWEMIAHPADEFVAEGDRIVVFGRCAWRHRKTGKVAESTFVHKFLVRDGKLADFAEFYDTAKAFAAATPDPV